MVVTTRYLFGGDSRPWSSADWTSSDDRVRGGSSVSHLEVDRNGEARFFGNLDYATLGGAGFASQRTVSDDLEFDLSAYEGLQLLATAKDMKQYTIILKDEVHPLAANGREQASISYEYTFALDHRAEPSNPLLITIPWSAFQPTYRGKVQHDAEPLNTKSIKRVSFMLRSFFGSQQGDFSLNIRSIRAYKHQQKQDGYPFRDQPSLALADSETVDEKAAWMEPKSSSWFCCL